MKMSENLNQVTLEGIDLKNRFLVSIGYSGGILEIQLSPSEDGGTDDVKISFDWIYSFRLTDEGDLLKLQNDLCGKLTLGIYTLNDSGYLRWFNEQSFDIHNDEKLNHYLIVTSTEIVEVISTVGPSCMTVTEDL